MTKPLSERLADLKSSLDRVGAALSRHVGRLPFEVEERFRDVANFRNDVDHWLEMIASRDAARQLLTGLEDDADSYDRVQFGSTRIRFQHARLLGVQAHLTMTWALADRLTGMVGRVLCTPDAGNNEQSPAQLVSHFIQKERKKNTAATLFQSLKSTFGWPIGISYALRNHFVHDGAQMAGANFFEGIDAASRFKVSADGWQRIAATAQSRYDVDQSLHRAGTAWPTSLNDDLRATLDVCQREMDDGLGVLIGSASGSLLAHVACMLGED